MANKWSVVCFASMLVNLHGVNAQAICNTHWQEYCSAKANTTEGNPNYKCDKNLKLFICQFMNHVCTSLQSRLPPCRETCLRVRNTCKQEGSEHILFSWSNILACDIFPLRKSGNCKWKQHLLNKTSVDRSNHSTAVPIAPAVSVPVFSAPQCKCTGPRKHKVGRNYYTKKGFSYALKAVHLRTDDQIPGGPAVIDINIKKVLKKKGVNVEVGNQTLWVQRGCVCPVMKPNKAYLFLGYEDKSNQRLLYNEHCIAVPWKKKWPEYIKRWENRMKKHNNNSTQGAGLFSKNQKHKKGPKKNLRKLPRRVHRNKKIKGEE